MVLSFHSAVKDPMTVRAIPSLALISLPPSPFSSTMAPRYRNDSTCSKFPPLHVIVIFSHVLLTTITFVFLVFISSPYFLDASFTLSISCWSVSFDVATSTISSAYRKLFIIRPLIVIPIQLSASADSLITFSEQPLNDSGDIRQPCLTPFPILNHSVVSLSMRTAACWLSYRLLNTFTTWLSTPISFSTVHSFPCFTESKASLQYYTVHN